MNPRPWLWLAVCAAALAGAVLVSVRLGAVDLDSRALLDAAVKGLRGEPLHEIGRAHV